MATNADVAAMLLREAAGIFRTIAGGDPESDERKEEFATVYERAAELLEKDPTGEVAKDG